MAIAIRASVGGSELFPAGLSIPYLLGSLLGGLGLGAAAAMLGILLSLVIPVEGLLLLAAGVALLSAVWPTSLRWPENRRQIPRWWVNPPTATGLFLAGGVLGSGVFTFINHSVFHLALALLVTVGSMHSIGAVLLGGAYGLASSFPGLLQSGLPKDMNSEETFLDASKRVLGRSFPVIIGVCLPILVLFTTTS